LRVTYRPESRLPALRSACSCEPTNLWPSRGATLTPSPFDPTVRSVIVLPPLELCSKFDSGPAQGPARRIIQLLASASAWRYDRSLGDHVGLFARHSPVRATRRALSPPPAALVEQCVSQENWALPLQGAPAAFGGSGGWPRSVSIDVCNPRCCFQRWLPFVSAHSVTAWHSDDPAAFGSLRPLA